MIIAGTYSFKGGREVIGARFASELREIEQVIAEVDSQTLKTKTSREKTMPGRLLYNPPALNRTFRSEFETRGWHKFKVSCEYPTGHYAPGYAPVHPSRGAFREMDFVKNRVGVEVQFGKYAWSITSVPR